MDLGQIKDFNKFSRKQDPLTCNLKISIKIFDLTKIHSLKNKLIKYHEDTHFLKNKIFTFTYINLHTSIENI